MKIIITENKIRNIIRSELKNYLIQEGVFDTIRNIASTAVGNVKKDFEKGMTDLKSTQAAAKSTPEFSAIKAKLKPLGIEGNNLQAVYNYLYTKDKDGKYVFSIEDKIISDFKSEIFRLNSIVEDYFKNLKASIPTALQEVTHSAVYSPASTTSNVAPKFQLKQLNQKITPAQQIEVIYQKVLSFIDNSKQSGEKQNILIGSVLLYACQVANQAINIKQTKNPKQLGKLYSDFFRTLNNHLGNLPNPQQQTVTQQTTP